MLHLNSINNTTHLLLQSLCTKDYLNKFALAGGTALALQMGHRKSIDIDLFSFDDVDMNEISLQLLNEYDDIVIRRTTKVFIFGAINGIKSDFVKHNKAILLKPLVTIDKIRMYSIEDIAAMKLNAICGRGTKKDFYDIYLLLQQISLKDLLSFYEEKFQSDNSWMALKSLQYFEDAEENEPPELLIEFPTWKLIKKFIIETVNDYKL
jgi:predicted nucleotidyltransferase component of viral defense system